MSFHHNELEQLTHHYNNPQNEIIVFYGSDADGVGEILRNFLKGKSFFYYRARNCVSRLQLQLFYDEIREELPKGTGINVRYSDILTSMLSVVCKKRIIVIDEFQHMIKSDPEFMDDIVRTVHNKWSNQSVLFLLVTSNASWVEHGMVEKLGENAYEINATIALRPLSFADLRLHFSKWSFQDCVMGYAVFGGELGRIRKLDPELSLQENICAQVLTPGGSFHEQGQRILPEELREPAVYTTILEAMATGHKKLNELHKITGFERAKIIVYLKNLSELGITQKVESFLAPGHENVQKGVYGIRDPFIRFWFCFVYPHYSKLPFSEPERFYKKYVEGNLVTFSGKAYVDVCREYLENLIADQKLPYAYKEPGTWYGKVGTVDLIAEDDEGHILVAYCNFEKNKMSAADLEWNLYCISQAKVKCDSLYLFSYHSFDEKLKKAVSYDPSIVLIEGDLDVQR